MKHDFKRSLLLCTCIGGVLIPIQTTGILPPIPDGITAGISPGADIDPATLWKDGAPRTDVDAVGLYVPWAWIEGTENDFDWKYFEDQIATASAAGKWVTLRIATMNGAEAEDGGVGKPGNTPNWVFTKYIYGDDGTPADSHASRPGDVYTFVDDQGTTRTIPVFWNPNYLKRKKILIAMAGDHFTNDAVSGKEKINIVAVSVVNAVTEDWNPEVTNRTTLNQWIHLPNAINPGAGYTRTKIEDTAIKRADDTYDDGVFSGTTLTSNKAIFTQADIGKVITVDGVQGSVIVQKWKKVPSAPCTQVTINPPLTLSGEKVFHIVQRDSGIIDVTMAAFPNQYVTMAIGTSGSLLDKYVDWNANPKVPKGGEADPDNYMARQIGQLARAKYDTFYPRFMVQENSISAYMPVYPGDLIHGDHFTLLKEVAADGGLVGGQDLWYCYEDSDYRMNRGSNCDRSDPDCPHEGVCENPCIAPDWKVLRTAGELGAAYIRDHAFHPGRLEIYEKDVINLSDTIGYLHGLYTK